jgi:hypothetical protein
MLPRLLIVFPQEGRLADVSPHSLGARESLSKAGSIPET